MITDRDDFIKGSSAQLKSVLTPYSEKKLTQLQGTFLMDLTPVQKTETGAMMEEVEEIARDKLC